MSTTIFLVNPVNFGGSSWTNDYSTLFDGVDEYVDNGRLTMLESVSNFSYSFWFKRIALTNGKIDFGRYVSATNNFYGRMNSTGSYFVDLSNSTNGSVKTNTAKISAGVWQHIAVVFDGSLTGNINRCKIYINGVNETVNNMGTIPATSSSDTSDFYIGCLDNVGTATNFQNGNYDEVSFFDYSLSASEVTDIYNLGTPFDLMTLASGKQPEHFYRMGDGDTFPTITDNGATGGNDGTMTNMESSDFVLDTP